MQKPGNNYAFIDSQNLNLSVRSQGWDISFKKFRIYLKEKYAVTKAFVFLGYIERNEGLYASLEEADFICVFKPIFKGKGGIIKGNCDAELVLQTMIEYENYNKAIIVTGDGDFHCLVKYLHTQQKLLALFIPNRGRFSSLFKYDFVQPYLRYVNDLRNILARNR